MFSTPTASFSEESSGQCDRSRRLGRCGYCDDNNHHHDDHKNDSEHNIDDHDKHDQRGLRINYFVHLGYTKMAIYKLASGLGLCYFANCG
jgi:hypothetical protein